ncbi:ABC transporter ATP-binding protein [Flavobacterium luminosum]|uniref:ABC transporter ATP-binding protein/permease n=1 Tax=Flavobacterium luminosum TaxID=2949086 RepID=A0ABT0TNC1_9FLAO|nr:ABC transporter ATP-binding protein [Flavobacterium sp. HXWNR70]MCL9808845.1 ABC transporter ATP-binding protein/permease [Flavobacterium sp. HXWNR70]
MKELRYLNPYFLKYKYHFFGGIFATIAAQIFSLVSPKLISQSIASIEDYLKKGNSNPEVIKSLLIENIIWMTFAVLASGVLTFMMRQTLIVMSRHIEFDLKNVVFKHYEVLTQNFYKKNRTGDLMNRISEDVGRVRMYVGPAVMYTINTIIRFTVVIIFMLEVSPKLTVLTLLPLPILAYFIFKLSTEINKRSLSFQKNLSTLSSFTQEFFSGIRVIKSYHIENFKQTEFSNLSNESNQKSLELAKVQAFFGPLMLLLIGISNLLVIALGGFMYINGSIANIAVIAEFIIYINMLVWPVTSIGWVSSLIQEAEASQKRLNEFLSITPEITNENQTPMDFEGNISFKNVSLVYEDTHIKALDGISFDIKKGETLAIIGRTGSGKSSILSLISRLYDPTEGSIEVNGMDIKKVNLNALRNAIGTVPQDAFLFSDSIINNIKFGKENASYEEVIEAAKNAAVHQNIINFKDQYETVLGERGITLSGGQKQRVSIARALIKDPAILLLDDCLSAVDTETEEEILNNLNRICANKTTIIVSHRVSSAKNAQKIIVLEHGKIAQQGTHNQLINEEGYYKELYLKQITEKEM